MGVIYWFSAQPNSNEVTENIFGGLNYYVRKGSHMTEFAILFGLAYWFEAACIIRGGAALEKLKPLSLKLFLPFLFVFLYAASDEWHQSFVPGRTALFSDVLIDCAGAAIATFITFLIERRTT
jgi:hypothetical protein